jgi:hypothetical protein
MDGGYENPASSCAQYGVLAYAAMGTLRSPTFYVMSGQQNPNYFSANQINLIYSTVIGQITSEEYFYLVSDMSTS